MYESAKAQGVGQLVGSLSNVAVDNRKLAYPQSPTLSQNIDQRIENLQAQVERLQNVKRLLAQPAGLLAVPIDDLRFAMNY